VAVAPKRGPYESSAEIAPVTEAGFPQISRGILGKQSYRSLFGFDPSNLFSSWPL